ncbi:hypothetical protein LPJ56_000423 [Coemansia sp. RSA 2599]|nr:hypothetical protein LPJ75_000079 [Coemansia sp. RSA 2598]KAJ1829324.1 hypothetical protein LPJ56_000423 [Coemansia sp. RSA 2599]
MYAEIERLLLQVGSESGHDVVHSRMAPESASSTQSSRPAKRKRMLTGVQPLDIALGELNGDDAMISPMLELLGQPGSGKTQTLYRICASAALPETLGAGSSAVRLNGHGSHVLFVDVDGKSDMRLLCQYLRSLVRESVKSGCGGRQVNEQLLNEAVGSALDRIHVFSPETTQSLVATLAMLPRYAAQHGIEAAGCVLLVDGLGANFWFDKRSADNTWLRIKRATPMFRLQQLLVDTLQQVRRQMGCLCVVTSVLFLRSGAESALAKSASQESMGPSSQGSQGSQPGQRQHQQRAIEADGTVYRDHMIPRWQSVVSRSFVLESALCRDGPGTELRLTPVADGRGRQQPYRAYIGAQGLRAAPTQSEQ